LKDALKNNPKDSGLRLEMARFYYGTQRKDDLLALLNQMKSNLKEFPDAYLQAGDFFIRVGQFDEAIKQFEEGIQKDPARKNVYLGHEIEDYVRANKLDLAYSKNNEILKSDPKDTSARALKATFALDKGEINQAESELQAVVTAKPNNFVARFNLGRAHFAKGEYEQARQEFEKSVDLNPDYTPARLALTQVALLRGDYTSAVHDADEIMKRNPGSIQGRIMKADALQRQQKYDEARALLNPVLEKNPKQEETLLELGVLDLNEKKYKEALDLFRRAWEASPGNIRGLLGESRAYLLAGQPDKSVELIQSESTKAPDRLDLLRELGNAQTAAGDFDNAIANFQKLMSRLKDARQQSQTWVAIAQAYRYKGDVMHSVEALEKSRLGVPENPLTVTNLGIDYDELGRKDLAKKYYEMAIKIDANNALALNNLAYLISETNGDLNEALTYASRAKQKLPNYTEITDTLGWIYIKKNLTDNALDTYKGLVAQAPQKSTFRYHYAIALYQKGDRETAKKECQAALADRPNKVEEKDIRQLMSKIG
jgi:tetratricopeptide (TPR) repeat protein